MINFSYQNQEISILSNNCKKRPQIPLRVKEGGSQSYDESTDLAGQFIHQGHNGVLEQGGGSQRSFRDLCDAQLTIWPHLLQDMVGTMRQASIKGQGLRRGQC